MLHLGQADLRFNVHLKGENNEPEHATIPAVARALAGIAAPA